MEDLASAANALPASTSSTGLTVTAGPLTEDQLQVLGAMPFDPQRANPKALALLAELQARALIDVDRESHALLLSPWGRHVLAAALKSSRNLMHTTFP